MYKRQCVSFLFVERSADVASTDPIPRRRVCVCGYRESRRYRSILRFYFSVTVVNVSNIVSRSGNKSIKSCIVCIAGFIQTQFLLFYTVLRSLSGACAKYNSRQRYRLSFKGDTSLEHVLSTIRLPRTSTKIDIIIILYKKRTLDCFFI